MRLMKTSSMRTTVLFTTVLFGASLTISCAEQNSGITDPNTSDTSTTPSSDTDSSASPSANIQGTATVKVDGRSFEFSLAFCAIHGEEVLFHGPGNESGQNIPSYIDADLMASDYGEVRFDIGASDKFQSTEDFYAIGESEIGTIKMVPAGDNFVITGVARKSDGSKVGQGEVQFNCK